MATIDRGTTFTWLGHATWHLATPGGKRLLIDAWLDTNPAAPDAWKSRIREEGVDYLLVTHGHGDHIGDLVSLAKATTKIVCQFDLASWMVGKGIPEDKIIGFNKGGTVDLGGVKATMTHATHSSTFNDNGTLVPMGTEAGYLLEMENGLTIYHTGDTDVTSDMQIVGQLHRPEVTILPIGDFFTMGPRHAAYALKLIGSAYALPSHYGTFPLLHGTPEALREHLKEFDVACEVIAAQPGESIS